MTIISLEDVGMSYGPRCLFEGVTFGIDDGDKVGLVGFNGSGKSTLLRIIAGREQSLTEAAYTELQSLNRDLERDVDRWAALAEFA